MIMFLILPLVLEYKSKKLLLNFDSQRIVIYRKIHYFSFNTRFKFIFFGNRYFDSLFINRQSQRRFIIDI